MNLVGQLVKYDEMCRAIDAAYDVDEVSDIRDKALAIEMYMRQQRNPEPERRACEIRLRAERKLGKLLATVDRAQGQRSSPPTCSQAVHKSNEHKSFKEHLDEHGISEKQASRWQQLANVPEHEFEAALAAPVKPSTNGIIQQNYPKQKAMDPKALWVWGRLRDFEKDGILETDPKIILSEMTDGMKADVLRLAILVAEWLKGACEND